MVKVFKDKTRQDKTRQDKTRQDKFNCAFSSPVSVNYYKILCLISANLVRCIYNTKGTHLRRFEVENSI